MLFTTNVNQSLKKIHAEIHAWEHKCKCQQYVLKGAARVKSIFRRINSLLWLLFLSTQSIGLAFLLRDIDGK